MSGDEVQNDQQIEAAFAALGELEKGFAEVELKHLRQKEFDLKPLYAKRSEALQKIPDFWSTVFLNPPAELEQWYSPQDLEFFSALTSFSVERYQIESQDKGEPRSLRFSFEFAANDLFTDTKLVKEFEYVAGPDEDSSGSFISTPVTINWKNKKNDPTDGVLDAAVELYRAEQAMTLKKSGGKTIEMVERQGLWQYEKLREKLEKLEESGEERSFTLWFGYRGAVASLGSASEDKPKSEAAAKDDEAEAEDEDEDDEGLLDVEVFEPGEEVAIILADELWSDAIDHYMQANEESDGGFDGFEEDDEEEADDEVDGEDAPELVPAAGDSEEVPARPAKRRRNA